MLIKSKIVNYLDKHLPEGVCFGMARYTLRYLPSGYVFIDPKDNCDKAVDALLATGYRGEFCVARDFDAAFISRLMESGFLIMSMELKDEGGEDGDDAHDEKTAPETENRKERFFILLPKLHLVRSVLFFSDLHIKKSIRPFLSRYELRVNTDFDRILDTCVKTHGADWLTPPLVAILKDMREAAAAPPLAREVADETRGIDPHRRYTGPKETAAKPFSFAVYREGKIRAGEIGVVVGRVYTSYSGYYEERNAGTVQMILMTQWLQKAGFDFLDLGMPLDYKTRLGARDIAPETFVALFRAART